MKKKFFIFLMAIVSIACLAVGLPACSGNSSGSSNNSAHVHNYGQWISNGESTHSRECNCGDTQTQYHTFSGNTCSRCGYINSSGNEENNTQHDHNYNQENTNSKYLKTEATCTAAAEYYYSCTCGEKGTATFKSGSPKGHAYNQKIAASDYLKTEATCTAAAEYYYSCTCGEKGTATFKSGSPKGHTYNQKIADSDYLKTEATCTVAAEYYYSCICGEQGTTTFKSGSPKGHSFSSAWSSDSNYHWHKATCGHTSEISGKAEHKYDDDYICSICKFKFDIGNKVSIYIDGEVDRVIYAEKKNDYKIAAPEKPEDITTNPNSTKYFYGWFVDANYQTPLTNEYRFTTDGKIYGKWINVNSTRYKYTVSEGKATITGYVNYNETVLVVPAYINSFPVKSISGAFKNQTQLRTVILCDGIEEINNSAFSGCNSMEKIEIPDSVTSIGGFSGCTSLTNITIPDGVTSIGSSAFYNCKLLRSITISDSVTNIGDSAFRNCSSLTSVTIGDGVKNIGYSAFDGCSSLTSITIPNGVMSIGSGAFYGCTSLTQINYNATECADFSNNSYNYIYQSSFNNVFSYAGQSGEGITVAIGANVKRIPENLFNPCNSSSYSPKIVSVVFKENSVCESIGSGAFYNCKLITNITIPDRVTSIEGGAFGYCDSLASVTFGKNSRLTSIGGFSGCTSLTNITIPDGVTSIGDGAFSSCSSLTNITIPDGVTSIGNSAFSSCSLLTNIIIPAGVMSIGEYAFNYCKSLTQINYNATECADLSSSNHIFAYAGQNGKGIIVTIGANVKKIPAYLFNPFNSSSYSPKIVSVIFEENSVCESIGSYAFAYCSSMKSITIGNGHIRNYAFYGCTSLIEIKYNVEAASSFPVKDNYIFYDAGKDGNGITLTIGANVKSIPQYLFNPCNSSSHSPKIVSVIFEENSVCKNIYDYAFAYCNSITSITIPDSMTRIGLDAFLCCAPKYVTFENIYDWNVVANYNSGSYTYNKILISSSELENTTAATKCFCRYNSWIWFRG